MTTEIYLTDACEQALESIGNSILAFVLLAFVALGAGVGPAIAGNGGDIVQVAHRPDSVVLPCGPGDLELASVAGTEEALE